MSTIEKTSVRSGPWQEIFAQGVQVGDWLYVTGQVSMDAEGTIVGPDDLAAQVTQAYANVAAVLSEFGADMSNVIDETLFVTDFTRVMADIDDVMAARNAAFGGRAEVTQTMVEVAALVMPELMIEIKCVAHL